MRLVVILALAGCQAVFPLTVTPDAPPVFGPCPATADGPDEDGDGCANDRDDCPATANPTQADGDGDGVGDACDPHPTVPGDEILAVDLLDTIQPWTADDPQHWKTGDGSLTNRLSDGSAALFRAGAGAPQQYAAIEIGYSVRVASDGGSSIRLSLLDGPEVTCHVDFNSGDYATFLTNSGQEPVRTPATEQRLVLGIDPSGVHCTLGVGPVALGTLDDAQDLLEPGPASIKVELTNFEVELHSAVLYGFTPD